MTINIFQTGSGHGMSFLIIVKSILRLIRSESLRRREGSRALKEDKRQRFFSFKPRADDCTTKQLILLKDMFSFSETLDK